MAPILFNHLLFLQLNIFLSLEKYKDLVRLEPN